MSSESVQEGLSVIVLGEVSSGGTVERADKGKAELRA
jgi:hypothetical protein